MVAVNLFRVRGLVYEHLRSRQLYKICTVIDKAFVNITETNLAIRFNGENYMLHSTTRMYYRIIRITRMC